MADLRLRPLTEDDSDWVFAMMADPEAVAMAAFTADDPTDRAAFDEHHRRVLALPGVDNRAILDGDEPVGTIAVFPSDDGPLELTYWVDRAHWGRGLASEAVAALVADHPERPLLARVAEGNAGSLRVLEKAGFHVVGTDSGYAAGRGAETEETLLRLE